MPCGRLLRRYTPARRCRAVLVSAESRRLPRAAARPLQGARPQTYEDDPFFIAAMPMRPERQLMIGYDSIRIAESLVRAQADHSFSRPPLEPDTRRVRSAGCAKCGPCDGTANGLRAARAFAYVARASLLDSSAHCNESTVARYQTGIGAPQTRCGFAAIRRQQRVSALEWHIRPNHALR